MKTTTFDVGSVWNLGLYANEFINQNIRLYLYVMVGFFVPFLVGHPQLLVGVIVNTMLVVGALELRSLHRILPLVIAPSLGVLSRGLIFGPFTPFLLYMIPAIWLGNLVLVMGVKYGTFKKIKNYWVALGASVLVKAGILYSMTSLLVTLSVIPLKAAPVFLTAMGITQVVTALVGGALAFGLVKSKVTRRFDNLI